MLTNQFKLFAALFLFAMAARADVAPVTYSSSFTQEWAAWNQTSFPVAPDGYAFGVLEYSQHDEAVLIPNGPNFPTLALVSISIYEHPSVQSFLLFNDEVSVSIPAPGNCADARWVLCSVVDVDWSGSILLPSSVYTFSFTMGMGVPGQFDLGDLHESVSMHLTYVGTPEPRWTAFVLIALAAAAVRLRKRWYYPFSGIESDTMNQL